MSLREAFAEKQSGKSKRAGGTEKLEGLGKSDPHFADRHIIEDVGEADAGDRGDNEDDVHFGLNLQRRLDFAEGEGERQK